MIELLEPFAFFFIFALTLNLCGHGWLRILMTGGPRSDVEKDIIKDSTPLRPFDPVRIIILLAGATLFSLSNYSSIDAKMKDVMFYTSIAMFLFTIVRTYMLYSRGWKAALQRIG